MAKKNNNNRAGGKHPNSPRYSDRYGPGHVNPYLGGQGDKSPFIREMEERQQAARQQFEQEQAARNQAENQPAPKPAENAAKEGVLRQRRQDAAQLAVQMQNARMETQRKWEEAARAASSGQAQRARTNAGTARRRTRSEGAPDRAANDRAANDRELKERLRRIQEQALQEAREFVREQGAAQEDIDAIKPTSDVRLRLSKDNRPLIAIESTDSEGRTRLKWVPVELSDEDMADFFPAAERPAERKARPAAEKDNKEEKESSIPPVTEEAPAEPEAEPEGEPEEELVLIPIAGMDDSEPAAAAAGIAGAAAGVVELLSGDDSEKEAADTTDSEEESHEESDNDTDDDASAPAVPVISYDPEEEESADEDTADEDTADEDTADEDTADEDTADEDTADEESADEETTDEDTTDEETTDEETTDEDTTDEESSDEESADEEPTDEDTADEDTADEEPADEDTTDEESSDEEPADEEPADEDTADEDTADEDTADEDTADEDTTDEDTADEDTADEEPADEDTADEDTADEDTADEESADEDTADEEPADEESADEEVADEDDTDEESEDTGDYFPRSEHRRRRSRPTDVDIPGILTGEDEDTPPPTQERRRTAALRPSFDELEASDRYAQSRYTDEEGEQDDSLFIRREKPETQALFVLPEGVKLPKYIDDDDFVEHWLNEEEEDMATVKKRRRRRIAAFIGAATMALALIGSIAVAKWGIGMLGKLGSSESQKEIYAEYISPVVMSEVPVFEAWDAIPQEKLLQSAVFSVLMDTEVTYERDDTGNFIIPSTDIVNEVKEVYGAYGDDEVQEEEINDKIRSILYGSVGEDAANADVYYVDMEDSFHVADALSGPTPQVTQISKRDNTITLHVEYLEDLETGSGAILYSRQFILVTRDDGHYIQAIRELDEDK